MAYTDDAVKAKLSALNETQEAIVTVAQWIMFHKYDITFPHELENMFPPKADIRARAMLTGLSGDTPTEQLRSGLNAC